MSYLGAIFTAFAMLLGVWIIIRSEQVWPFVMAWVVALVLGLTFGGWV